MKLMYECSHRTDTAFRVRVFDCIIQASGGLHEIRVLEGGVGAILADVEALIQRHMADIWFKSTGYSTIPFRTCTRTVFAASAAWRYAYIYIALSGNGGSSGASFSGRLLRNRHVTGYVGVGVGA